jgi:hypothetical protein
MLSVSGKEVVWLEHKMAAKDIEHKMAAKDIDGYLHMCAMITYSLICVNCEMNH